MESQLDIQLHNRKIFHHYLKHFSLEQLNKIPEGFNNNILWNIAHTIVTQQMLMYKRASLSINVPNECEIAFTKGSMPERDFTAEEVREIDSALFSTYEKFEVDLAQGRFAKLQPYTTSTNMVLDNVETTQNFILFHDGIHIGSILALAKLV